MHDEPQGRATKTRIAIVHAFNTLILGGRRRIRVGDVIAEAGVGRSTFYDHFSSAEQLHMAALAQPFAILADAAAGRGDPRATQRLLTHFWENRRLARDTFVGRPGDHAQRLLAQLVEERLEGPLAIPSRLAAQQLATAALAPVRGWLLGEASCPADRLAGSLCRSGAALLATLRTN
jgi:AcrR family transcriptional regulator